MSQQLLIQLSVFCIIALLIHFTSLTAYPFQVLLIPLEEVYHPVAKGFEGGRGKDPPDGGNLPVIKCLGQLV